MARRNTIRIYIFLFVGIAAIVIAQQVILHYQVNPQRCIGCGQCVPQCPVNAIKLVKGRAVIDPNKCIACGSCFSICPVSAISTVMESVEVAKPAIDTTSIVKSSQTAREIYTEEIEPDKGDTAAVTTDTIGKKDTPVPLVDITLCVSCGNCASLCPEDAIEIIDGKPVIDPKKCVRCGICVENCPTGALGFPWERNLNRKR